MLPSNGTHTHTQTHTHTHTQLTLSKYVYTRTHVTQLALHCPAAAPLSGGDLNKFRGSHTVGHIQMQHTSTPDRCVGPDLCAVSSACEMQCCSQHTVGSTLFAVHCWQCTIGSTLMAAQCWQHTVGSTLSAVHCLQYTVGSTLLAAH
jgi:hypothetical protein